MELPTTTLVDNPSEEGDNEEGIRGDSPPSPPKRFNSGFDTFLIPKVKGIKQEIQEIITGAGRDN